MTPMSPKSSSPPAIGYLINPASASSVTNLAGARRSAEALGMEFRSYPIERPEDLERTFAAIAAP
jgi:ABC-type uncharacterized transport system substrate-binding protein